VQAFFVLRAVSLAHEKAQKYDAAYATGKTIVRGTKRQFGHRHLYYLQALGFLANILEKKGDYIEAEALRLTVPALPEDLYEDTPSDYLTRMFLNSPEDESEEAIVSCRLFAIPRNLDLELIPAPKRDGLNIAVSDESSTKQLGEIDTGKEVDNALSICQRVIKDAPKYFDGFTIAPQTFTTALYFAKDPDWNPHKGWGKDRALVVNCGWYLLESAIYGKFPQVSEEPSLSRVWGPSSSIGG
jgi:hypothetical protein